MQSDLEKKLKEAEQYRPPLTKRPDFDLFWEQTLNAAKKHNVDSRFIRLDYPSPFAEVYEVRYFGYDETLIYGIYIRPLFSEKTKLPCLIQYHGFTQAAAKPSQLMHWAMLGISVLAVDCRIQGGRTGNCAGFRSGGLVENVTTLGLLDRDEYYYKAVYIDAVKAIEAVRQRPEVDEKKIIVRGTSQGGALAIAVSALSQIPALCIANVPSNSNLEARVIGRHGSFAAVNQFLQRYPEEAERAFETLSYFDTMNMADRIQSPVFASVALSDEVCPAKCFYATYNRICAEKEITVYPFNGHDGAAEVHLEKEIKWLRTKGMTAV